MRSNLDPFGEHSDHECWDALTRCHLVKANGTSRLGESWKLDDKVDPSASLSAGEKQLVALARAILRHSQVIIMDEATSQIDTELDDKVCKIVLTILNLIRKLRRYSERSARNYRMR